LIVFELFCFYSIVAKKIVYHQRCYGDIFANGDGIGSIFESICKPCESSIKIGSSEPHAHVIFLLPPWAQILEPKIDMMHPLLSSASNMFRRGFDVTILELRDTSCPPPRQKNLPAMITASLPCGESIRPNATLHHVIQKVYQLNMCLHASNIANKHSSILDGPYGTLHLVPRLLRTLTDVIPRLAKQPQAIVLESNNVAGVLVAETIGIPVVMIASPNEINLITEKSPIWSGIGPLLERRLASFKIGFRLTTMNMIRKALNLPAYHLPSEYYEQVTSVLVHPHYTISRPLPHNTEVIRPLITECVMCNPSHSTQTNLTILVHPLDLDYLKMRSVIRAIVVAKTTFQNQADILCDNEEDSQHLESTECKLHKIFSQLTAVLLIDNKNKLNVPELLPTYIQTENSNSLDSLARHPSIVGIISHCDASSYIPAAMGLQIICISREDDFAGKLVYNGMEKMDYMEPNVDAIAQELVNRLLHDRNLRNRFWEGERKTNYTIETKNSAGEIIARVSYVSKTRNISSMSTKELRLYLGQPPLKQFELLQAQHLFQTRSFFAISFGAILAAIYYAHIFVLTVKHKNQLSFWRRKRRWLSLFVEDVDYALLDFAKWASCEEALHNRWTSYHSQSNGAKEHGRSRTQIAHNEKNRKRKTVKRR